MHDCDKVPHLKVGAWLEKMDFVDRTYKYIHRIINVRLYALVTCTVTI